MDPHETFRAEVEHNIDGLAADGDLQALSRTWLSESARHKYCYNFSWFGRPAIQFPNDAWALQELVWKVRPDLIIETGIAHGGSLIYSASLLALLDLCDATERGEMLDPRNPKRKVLGIDIDIRAHNREAIEAHPLAPRIDMIEGSSIAAATIAQVAAIASGYKRILVCLDSNHTRDHVLAELEAYAPLVSPGSYCIVFDTLLEDMPEHMSADRPRGPGNGPKSAVHAFLKRDANFEIDGRIDKKLLITVAPDGFLKRIR
ncbi:cephalosporin hydroxylase family protein [Hoeflea ulvae]|uniref:Cephalosporin hydroxylase family protein n=1 Tax=Hoeflea ulvae TaxID=2983764 RepID=A0ABT3YD51_9HYPH|nr:cephalosporin hydroxylase family protein [Hoeflea ulvae]MCY0093617.1 cephalosporin hydroxylase family protein [Hoeflea ulvae]